LIFEPTVPALFTCGLIIIRLLVFALVVAMLNGPVPAVAMYRLPHMAFAADDTANAPTVALVSDAVVMFPVVRVPLVIVAVPMVTPAAAVAISPSDDVIFSPFRCVRAMMCTLLYVPP
jgi:hypothetical protein